MSRATRPGPARICGLLAATMLMAMGALAAIGTAPAEAAKPCWERLMDDWIADGRIDGTYSRKCMEEARKNLPEDVRAYSDIEEKIDSAIQNVSRSVQGGGGGSGADPPTSGTPRNDEGEPQPRPTGTGPRNESPIQSVLAKGTTDADSIPLPLIVLAALALLLMAAGAAGLVARKLQARRARDT
jgi:polyhydroxyalkanoate synthesis regulator phasin